MKAISSTNEEAQATQTPDYLSLAYGHMLGHTQGAGHRYRGNLEFRLELFTTRFRTTVTSSSIARALLLERKGFTRARPWLGGIDAWQGRNYPVDLRAAVSPLNTSEMKGSGV
jgi:hypothetical protein